MKHSYMPGVFGPEALSAMGEAYEAALASQPNAVREAIAGRIIAAARLGERDPIRLRAAALTRPWAKSVKANDGLTPAKNP